MASSVEDTLVVRMEASLRKFERQMEAGRKAAETSAVASERAWKRAGGQIAANANQAGTGLQRMIQIGGSGRFVLQNTANQIGDIAVQMGSGTSASRALGQQLPQLLGGFGALGGTLGILGPLMGTVAALGIPLAAALLSVGDEAESTADRIKALSDSIAALKSAQGLASMSAGELVQDYGALADEARAIFEINRQIASLKTNNALASVTKGVAAGFGLSDALILNPEDIADTLNGMELLQGRYSALEAELYRIQSVGSQVSISRIEEIQAEMDGLRDLSAAHDNVAASMRQMQTLLGISEDEARKVAEMFAAIGQADGMRGMADAAADLVAYLDQVVGRTGEATDEGRALHEELVGVVVQMLEAAKIDIASPIAEGANAAAALKGELAAALALFNSISAQSSKQYSGRGGDPRDFESGGSKSGYQSELGYQSVDDLIARYSKTGRRGGGRGGGGSRIPDGMREAERLYESTRSEAEKYAAEVERINELHRLFPEIITTEVRDKALGSLKEAANGLGSIADNLARGFEDAFAAMVTGAGSAKDAVRALLSDLSRLFIRSAFKGLDLGGLFSSIIPGFATGTSYAPGGLAMVGERGPELVNLPRGSQVIPNGQTERMMAGGSGPVTISVTVNGARGNTEIQEMVHVGVRQGLEQYDRAGLPRSIRRVNADPRRIR